MKPLVLVLLVLLSMWSCKNGQVIEKVEKNGYTLKLFMEPENPIAGTEIHLHYQILGRGYREIFYPEPQNPFGKLEVISWDTQKNGAELTLLPLKAGEYNLPGLSFFLDGEEALTLQLSEFNLNIPSQLGPDSILMVADNSIRIGFLRTWQWIVFICVFIVICVLIYALIFHSLYKKKKFQKLSRELDLRLDQISWESLLEKEEPRVLYLNISYEIRYFCDRVFYTHSLEKTSREFQGDLLNLPVIRQSIKPWFIDFCNRADRVKYAADSVSRENQEEDVRQARALLKEIQRYQKEREEYESA